MNAGVFIGGSSSSSSSSNSSSSSSCSSSSSGSSSSIGIKVSLVLILPEQLQIIHSLSVHQNTKTKPSLKVRLNVYSSLIRPYPWKKLAGKWTTFGQTHLFKDSEALQSAKPDTRTLSLSPAERVFDFPAHLACTASAKTFRGREALYKFASSRWDAGMNKRRVPF